jgi:hypothetical protein
MTMNIPLETPIKRKAGRPKGAKNKPKTEPDMREPMREALRDDKAFIYKPDEEIDRLRVPKEMIPDGMEYLWVTSSIYGQPQPQRLARFQKQGWVPVPASRHDGLFMPKGWQGAIEIDGLVLHERSKKISDMARAHEINKARNQLRTKEMQLLGGGMDGVTLDTQHPTALRTNRINKSYEKIEIPEE